MKSGAIIILNGGTVSALVVTPSGRYKLTKQFISLDVQTWQPYECETQNGAYKACPPFPNQTSTPDLA